MAYPNADFVTICDSWGAGWQRGVTLPTLTVVPTDFGGLGAQVVTFTFHNTASWWASDGSAGAPVMFADQKAQGRQGFSHTSGKGSLVDAFLRVAENFDLEFTADNINFHEYGCGATTAGVYDYGGGSYTSGSGAYAVGLPTHQEAPGTAGTGLLYGCPPGQVPPPNTAGGWQLDGRRSPWLQKQTWLNDGTHPGVPEQQWANWSLCDMIQFPPTGNLVVFLCLSGNDAINAVQRRLLIDPYTGAADPTGVIGQVWDAVYNTATDDGYIRRIVDAIYMLNPTAEIVWVSYMNMAVDDPNLPNARIRLPNTSNGDHSAAPDPSLADGPTNWKRLTSEGANVPDSAYTLPNDSPGSMNVCYWPGGARYIQTGMHWTPDDAGFHRICWLWNILIGTKNSTLVFQFFRDWVAHWMADTFARQFIPGGCTYFGCYNWYYNNGNWNVWNQFYTGYRWNAIYNHSRQVYKDWGTAQNWMFAGNTTPIDAYKWQTVMAKDVTTANIAKHMLRDKQRPRLARAETYYRGNGKRFISLDLYDKAPETVPPGTWVQSGTSQDDPDGVPTLPHEDFIDLHLQESGHTKWCDLIALYFLGSTDVFGDFPIAQDDFISTPTDVPVTFDPTANDSWGAGGVNPDPFSAVQLEVAPGSYDVYLNEPGIGEWGIGLGRMVTFTPAPGYSGTSLLRYMITNNFGKTSIATIHMVVGLPPTCPAVQVYNGRVGDVFGEALIAQYGVVYTVGSGTLPPGLCLDATGLVVGCPTALGTYKPTIHITNGGSQSVDCEITFIIAAAAPVTPTRRTGRGTSGSSTGWAWAVRPTGELIFVGPAGTSTVIADP